MPPTRYKHRARASLGARHGPSRTLCRSLIGLSRSLALAATPSFPSDAKRVAVAPTPRVFSPRRLTIFLSLVHPLSLLLPLTARSLFPSPWPSLPTLPTPDTRHPIPNYVKRFRILRPDYAASLPSHSLSLSALLSLPLSRPLSLLHALHAVAPRCCVRLSFSLAEKGFARAARFDAPEAGTIVNDGCLTPERPIRFSLRILGFLSAQAMFSRDYFLRARIHFAHGNFTLKNSRFRDNDVICHFSYGGDETRYIRRNLTRCNDPK